MDADETRAVRLTLSGMSASEADRLAGELQQQLLAQVPQATIERESNKSNTMDFGATLVLVLGSASVVAVAKGIAAWLARRPNATIEYVKENGDLVRFTGESS